MQQRIELEGCRCPGAPHARDWVEVIRNASLPLGAAVIAAIREADGDAAIAQGRMAEMALHFGIERWSFVDANGDPEPIDPEGVARLLPFNDAFLVADRVIDLHGDEILRPLTSRTSTRSQGGQTAGSTSPTPASGRPPRRRSAPSSPTSTDGPPSGDPVP